MTTPAFNKVAPRGAADLDYYALLELPERYAIDRAELERRYLDRSREVHPDRFVGAPAGQRVAALQQSMQLNDAYNTLKRPAPRAEYLLARRGVAITDNEVLDPAFLMEILELREELAEAQQARRTDQLGRLEAAMEARRDAARDAIAALFEQVEELGAAPDAGPGAADALLGQIKKHVIALRYIDRYLQEFEDDLEDEP